MGVEPFDLDVGQALVVTGPHGQGQVKTARRQRPAGTLPPKDGLGAVVGILDDQAAVLSGTADGRFAEYPQVADGQDQGRVARTKGGQAVEVGDQVEGEVRQLDISVNS